MQRQSLWRNGIRWRDQRRAVHQAHKLEDMQTRIARYVMKGLGLGDKPYQQNLPESINEMLKDWSNFVPQDMDKFIASVYDLVGYCNEEEELFFFFF